MYRMFDCERFCSFDDAVSNSDYMASSGWMIILIRFGQNMELFRPDTKYHAGTCLKYPSCCDVTWGGISAVVWSTL